LLFGTDSIPHCRAGHPPAHRTFPHTAFLWFLLGMLLIGLVLVLLFGPMRWILGLITTIFFTFVAPHYFWWAALRRAHPHHRCLPAPHQRRDQVTHEHHAILQRRERNNCRRSQSGFVEILVPLKHPTLSGLIVYLFQSKYIPSVKQRLNIHSMEPWTLGKSHESSVVLL
jgi:hypothetical protein